MRFHFIYVWYILIQKLPTGQQPYIILVMTKQLNSTFDFVDYSVDLAKGFAQFNYSITHKSKTFHFAEKLQFTPPLKKIPREVVHVLDSLHLLLGISYWKLFCSKNIKISSQILTKDQARFWNIVYTDGLG